MWKRFSWFRKQYDLSAVLQKNLTLPNDAPYFEWDELLYRGVDWNELLWQ